MQRQNITNQITNFFRNGGLLAGIIGMCIAVWLFGLLFSALDYLFVLDGGMAKSTWWRWFAVSSDGMTLLTHPWTLASYLFLHDGFWSLLLNMIILYCGGTLCCRYMGNKRFGWIYFVSGAVGALFYVGSRNFFPVYWGTEGLLGSSAPAVLGVLTAAAVFAPEQEIDLWLVKTFRVKMRWVVIAFLALDLLSCGFDHTGQYASHLGGMLCGGLMVWLPRKAKQRPPRPKREKKHREKKPKKARIKIVKDKKKQAPTTGRPLSDEEYNRRKAEDQKRVDAILDKISQSGYAKLTKEEKDFLFNHK